jgi:hypothetical protein
MKNVRKVEIYLIYVHKTISVKRNCFNINITLRLTFQNGDKLRYREITYKSYEIIYI